MYTTNLQVQNAAFHAQDMLESDLQDTAILMLTSLCWDEQLFAKAMCKITSELPAGALMIDYTSRLDSMSTCVLKVHVAVSWNDEQTLYVYIK